LSLFPAFPKPLEEARPPVIGRRGRKPGSFLQPTDPRENQAGGDNNSENCEPYEHAFDDEIVHLPGGPLGDCRQGWNKGAERSGNVDYDLLGHRDLGNDGQGRYLISLGRGGNGVG